MNKSEKNVGATHAAHEARHLSRKMKEVREGKKTKAEIEEYLKKVEAEREVLITRFKDCWSFVEDREQRVLQYKEIPVLTKEEAKKRVYLAGYEISDFAYCSRVEMFYQYGATFKQPQKDHVGMCAMLVQAAINDLTWAIGELRAYL